MKSKCERGASNRNEGERRLRALLARARACQMNDTKWREVLSVISNSANVRTEIRWAFVGENDLVVASVPPADSLLRTCLPRVFPYHCGPYRQIDSIEVPATDPTGRTSNTNDLDGLAAELKNLGQLPLTYSESGLRITSYVW